MVAPTSAASAEIIDAFMILSAAFGVGFSG
jgi:hypothetical protein